MSAPNFVRMHSDLPLFIVQMYIV